MNKLSLTVLVEDRIPRLLSDGLFPGYNNRSSSCTAGDDTRARDYTGYKLVFIKIGTM
ncbi:hypothetical protein HanPSC8_Chr06g0240481 [Helianthus annuus]|nr:hypothetical protein HanPSC8_Chr06g0240481 [Helianthus annuus]